VRFKDKKKLARINSRQEAREDEEQEMQVEERLRKWMRATILLGIGLLVSVTTVVRFLYGHPLYKQWNSLGKNILLVSMVLFVGFMYAVWITYIYWWYWRGLKRIHKKFAPPGSKYRTGNKTTE
jgi:putative effector of murein hydrolase